MSDALDEIETYYESALKKQEQDFLAQLDEVEKRYEATIARLEGELADAWDEGAEAPRDIYENVIADNPYRTESTA